MTIILGTIQLLLIGIICIYELKNKSTSIFLWAVLILMFGIMHFFTALTGDTEYNDKIINTSSLFVIIFCVTYLVTRILIIRKSCLNTMVFKQDLEIKKTDKKFFFILFLLLIIVVIYQIYILATGAGGLSNTSWGNMRKTTTNTGYFSYSQMFTTLFFTASSCIMVAIMLKDKKKVIVLITLILLEVIISRNRIEILPIFSALILLYISKIKKIKIKQIIVFSIVGIIAIYSVYALRVFRHYGTLETFIKNFNFVEFNDKVNLYLKTDNGELGLRRHFYYFMSKDNNFKDFGEGNTYIRMLLVAIPTKWSLGIKPNDFAISMGYAIDPTVEGYSIHPTLFGDCYANFGMLGMFMGIFWAIYATVLDYILNKQKEIVKYSSTLICSVAYIIIARGSVYNGFVWQFYGLIMLQVIALISRITIKKSEHRYESFINNKNGENNE